MNFGMRISGRIIAVTVMALLLVIPLSALMNLNAGRSDAEKRSLAAFPGFPADLKELAVFPKAFERFYNDRFGFRRQLVYLRNLLWVKVLKTSPIEKAVVGHDGWLFLADEHALDAEPFTPAQLEMWRVALEAKRAWLKARGIDYVFMVAPDKQSVYPEYLPPRYKKRASLTNLDLLLEYLEQTSTFRVIDVRQSLREAKARAPVFYRTDTHWNHYGAAIAHHQLMKHLAAGPAPAVTYTASLPTPQKSSVFKKGDIASMLLLQDQISDSEADPGPPVETAKLLPANVATPDGLLLSVSQNTIAHLPTAVVFHDSFFDGMQRHFVQQFGRVVMAGGGKALKFEQDIIEREQPQVVVEEIVERYLAGFPYVPTNILHWYQAGGR